MWLVDEAVGYENNAKKPVQDIISCALYLAATRPAKETAVWDTVTATVQAGIRDAQDIAGALNRALYLAVRNKKPESAVAALLNGQASANAALNDDGYTGRILAEAVRQEAAPAVIGLLHAKGADFADALLLMKTKPEEKWTGDHMRSLRAHCKRITGAPIPGDDVQNDVDDLRYELARTALELTQKTEELAAAQAEIARLTPKAGSSPQFVVGFSPSP
jgi:hypothetical protein